MYQLHTFKLVVTLLFGREEKKNILLIVNVPFFKTSYYKCLPNFLLLSLLIFLIGENVTFEEIKLV